MKNSFPNSLFLLISLLSSVNLYAQINHTFKLNYGGVTLNGKVEIAIKIFDKAKVPGHKSISFSDENIIADASKFRKPALIVTFSKLQFEAPKSLEKELKVSIPIPSLPKGFVPRMVVDQGPIKVGEKRVFSFEIAPADTILANPLIFKFAYISIGKRNFKLENNTFQLNLNISPPPLFPPNTSEKELWTIVSKLKTVKAYDVYIERYPQGKSIRKAKASRKYLIDYPPISNITTGETISTPIFIKDENKEWKKAKKINKIDTYNTYLKDFPNGKYSKQAISIVKSLSDSLDQKIIKSAEDDILGRLTYIIDDTMTIGQTYRVNLEIRGDTTTHFIEKLIAEVEEYSNHPEDLNTEIIQIGETMHAHLEESAPEEQRKFYIHLFGESPERQVDLYSSEPTIWEWDVTPLKEGYHPLYFTIEIITKKDGVEKPETLPVYDSKITILSRSVFETYKLEFIGGGIISSLIAIILVLFFRKKKTTTEQINLEELAKIKPLKGSLALIENDKIKEALEVLNQFLKDKDVELLQETILLKSRLSSNENSLNKATISKEAAANERNSIKLSALDIIERSKTIA